MWGWLLWLLWGENKVNPAFLWIGLGWSFGKVEILLWCVRTPGTGFLDGHLYITNKYLTKIAENVWTNPYKKNIRYYKRDIIWHQKSIVTCLPVGLYLGFWIVECKLILTQKDERYKTIVRAPPSKKIIICIVKLNWKLL